MPEINWNDLLVRVLGEFLKVFIATELHSALRDLQTSADVTAVHGYFASNEFETTLLNDIIDVQQALL